MARTDLDWLQDIVSARADTTGLDLAAFAAKPTTARSFLYSIAIMGEAAAGDFDDAECVETDLGARGSVIGRGATKCIHKIKLPEKGGQFIRRKTTVSATGEGTSCKHCAASNDFDCIIFYKDP